ncbi:hypothetical protein PMIT1313_01196 [Prochlorococcus marinus str. MIT 1313]|uniref:hypothetical protein n=1 Tax=Prochlorococcus TaxID=1218 RepID=UPI0007B392BE|nr:hypothetical protein [Prochlorococcus marinus]KZR69508.1 hypothetical protein PMIT1313_01196 [Prochlorococcus marinus str. MIT 1313]KZR72543.1 hypothetical protein PMIT1318_01057 [Prochlorococcus marinus str. MIT 1318]
MTTFTNQITQAEFEALVMSELEDMELSLEQLEMISGGGWLRDKIKQALDWVESKLGDGDGKHEVSDYKDEVIAVIKWLGEISKG